jgi:phosphoribosylformylglycinamidine synthase II
VSKAQPELRAVDLDLAIEHGLTPEEYKDICGHLGRVPTIEELGIFSVMWSEHCSYKSSRVHLKRLPQTGKVVLQGPGENAGAVDIGGGMAAVFKIESHNHPSYIEPYQGAATGVGGILRDVFTMGARPVANMNSLRFGSADHAKTAWLVNGVVSGVGGYGNSVGVATVGGEVVFDPGYDGNILVNAFTLGVVRADRIFRAVASGTGNPVLYVGSKTGRDGIHGASLLASSEFKEESEQMKPTVQVGDPFTENLLIEACLEVLKGSDVVAIQDMGAAGLTSSSVEMAGRGGVSIDLDLDKIPLRDESLTPYEMLLSESQERMVLVVKKGREAAVTSIFERWGLDCVVIGQIEEGNHFRATWRGERVVDIPVSALTDDAPAYHREIGPPVKRGEAIELAMLPEPSDYSRELSEFLASPNLCSRRWVYQQYDSFVGADTLVHPGGDAAVVRVRETGGALAMSCDCNARWVWLDPRAGAAHAVAEGVRNLAAVGARPLAASDCLNFGSPEKPEVMWEFSSAIDGLAEACTAFDAPVISGNVSFYNDTRGRSIPPTPTVSMVGLIDDSSKVATIGFGGVGERIWLLGNGEPELTASEFLYWHHGKTGDQVPRLDLEAERQASQVCVALIADHGLRTAHDVGEGGISVALAEMCFTAGIGAQVDLPAGPRADVALFGESGSRYLIAAPESASQAIEAAAAASSVRIFALGRTGGSSLCISQDGNVLVDADIADLAEGWRTTFSDIATGTVS